MAYPEVVVDVETMGVDSGSAPIAIGSVPFDRNNGIYKDVSFKIGIDFESVLKHDMNINAGTVKMWMKFPELWEEFQNGASPLRTALLEFNRWCDYYLQDDAIFWAKSPEFDMGRILRPAYDKLEMDFPWHRYRLKDLRTLKEVGLEEHTDSKRIHDPVADSVAEAKDVINYFNDIGEDEDSFGYFK